MEWWMVAGLVIAGIIFFPIIVLIVAALPLLLVVISPVLIVVGGIYAYVWYQKSSVPDKISISAYYNTAACALEHPILLTITNKSNFTTFSIEYDLSGRSLITQTTERSDPYRLILDPVKWDSSQRFCVSVPAPIYAGSATQPALLSWRVQVLDATPQPFPHPLNYLLP